MSIAATLPKKIEARNEETSDIRDVFAYSLGCVVLKRRICGPVKRYSIASQPERPHKKEPRRHLFTNVVYSRSHLDEKQLRIMKSSRTKGKYPSIGLMFMENIAYVMGFTSGIES